MKIGLRIPGAGRQMPFDEFCRWCVDSGFDAVDIGAATPEVVQTARDAGLVIGSSDLPGVGNLLSTDQREASGGCRSRKNSHPSGGG